MTEQTITDMLGHLEAACNAALQLKQSGAITNDEYERYFNNRIAQLEDSARSVKERIECDHENMEVVSTEERYYGSDGLIDIVWKCKDCDIVMEGQIDFQELWRYGVSSAVVREGFEVKQ